MARALGCLISSPFCQGSGNGCLVRCIRCHTRFSANWAQPAPGGSSAPGIFFLSSMAAFLASVITWLFDIPHLWWVLLLLGAVFVLRTFISWADCRRRAGLSGDTGETCPHCGAQNRVKPWSF